MVKTVNYKVKLVAQPFGNLRYRNRSVLILCQNKEGKFILGVKKGHYPPNIVRLVGGGVNGNETVIEAAKRELFEEMNVAIENDRLASLVQVNITGVYSGTIYKTQIYIFYCKLIKLTYAAGDDITDIMEYSEEEYQKLITRYFELKDDQLYTENGDTFSWGDYGRVYGFIHQIVLDELKVRSL